VKFAGGQAYYASDMNALGLPARIGYALVALAVGAAVGFYGSIWLLPKLVKLLQGPDAGLDEFLLFQGALGVGTGLAFSAALVALTLPWKRHRRRSGRQRRIVVSGVFVVLASLSFASQGHALTYDLAFAVWLAYAMAYTFVRYGVLDSARRASYEGPASVGDGE
jgi:hypothetical protein